MKKAINDRRAGKTPPVDTGSRFDWKEVLDDIPSAAIDRDGESVYVRFPNAIEGDDLVNTMSPNRMCCPTDAEFIIF